MANEPENVVPAPPKLDLTARLKKAPQPPSLQTETTASVPSSEKQPLSQTAPAPTDKATVAVPSSPSIQQQTPPAQPAQSRPVIQAISPPTKAISIPKPPSQVSATPKISIVPKTSEGTPSPQQAQPSIPQTTIKPIAPPQASQATPSPTGGATIKLQKPPSLGTTDQATQAKPIIQAVPQQTVVPTPTASQIGSSPANIQKPIVADSRPPSKRETSKIPLELATAMNVAAGGTVPKTIKIKPSVSPSGNVPSPNIAPITTPTATAAPTASAEKRKTSRISLEAALASAPAAKLAEETPKTIKLKKPGEVSTVKLATAPEVSAQEAPTISADAKSKTAKLEDLPPVPEEAESPTRRKTIKVKRGAGPSPVVPILVGGEEQAGAEPAHVIGGAPLQPIAMEDEPHWSFALMGVLGIIIAILIIWVLAAQAFGPDICLTKLSYGAPNLDLPWPGKIVSSR